MFWIFDFYFGIFCSTTVLRMKGHVLSEDHSIYLDKDIRKKYYRFVYCKFYVKMEFYIFQDDSRNHTIIVNKRLPHSLSCLLKCCSF